jgi:predicted ferric reductase
MLLPVPAQPATRLVTQNPGMSSTLIWYTARASGIVTLMLVSASVLFGLLMSTTLVDTRTRLAWVLDLHRFLGATAVAFLVLHVGSILLDSYVHFGLIEVLVPFTGTWHPVAVAWGIVSLYLLAAVEITSLLRARLSLRLWRSSHYLNFPLFGFAMLHGLTVGSDRQSALLRGACVAIIASCLVLVIIRIRTSVRKSASDQRSGTPITTSVR